MTARSGAPVPCLSLALISGAALALEVLLTRLFSIVQWHHFAYMVISVALLGFGASGTFLALGHRRLVGRFRGAYMTNLLLFALTAMPAFLIAQRLAVHPEQLLWAPLQMLRVTGVYLLLALPFFFAANTIGLAFVHCRGRAGTVYAADMVGAGLGGVAVIGLLYLVFPLTALELIGVAGGVAAVVAVLELHATARARAVVIALAAGVIAAPLLLLPPSLLTLSLSPYKALSQQLNVAGSRLVQERSSPLGLLSVVDNDRVPLRHAPGMSITATAQIPDQLGLFIDGGGPTAITRDTGSKAAFAWLDQLTSALPYHLGAVEDVLVLGAGGGDLVRQALLHEADHVTAVELNAELVALLEEDYRDFAGALYAQDAVSLHIGEARGFVARDRRRYDLVQLALMESMGAAAGGLHALNENYLYTEEAVRAYHARLREGGMLAITRWVRLPPRDGLRLFATALAALRAAGVAAPEEHLLMIRSWQTSTLLVRRGAFGPEEVARAREFCRTRAFDLVWYDGMDGEQANRFNRMPGAMMHTGASALAGAEAAEFLRDYKFDVRPTTDDRPYFSHYFRWRTLPELLSLRGQGGTALLESGYLILVVTLVQALLISLLVVLLPLWRRLRDAPLAPWPLGGYFAALGLAFLFVEIAFVQKFMLFLHHPVTTVALVLTGFLVFAGMGSLLAEPLARRLGRRRAVAAAVGVIAVLALVYVYLLPHTVFPVLAAASPAVKYPTALLLTGLLALPMGIPFPSGMARLSGAAPSLVPVAWAINGCASVVSAVLATVLAIHFGFSAVVLAAVGLYGLAALTFRF